MLEEFVSYTAPMALVILAWALLYPKSLAMLFRETD